MLPWSAPETSLKCSWYFPGTSLALLWYFPEMLLVLARYFSGTSLVLPRYFPGTSLVFPWYFPGTAPVRHRPTPPRGRLHHIPLIGMLLAWLAWPGLALGRGLPCWTLPYCPPALASPGLPWPGLAASSRVAGSPGRADIAPLSSV